MPPVCLYFTALALSRFSGSHPLTFAHPFTRSPSRPRWAACRSVSLLSPLVVVYPRAVFSVSLIGVRLRL